MTRRLNSLLLSLLAILALLTPATNAADAQNRVRAFSLAAHTNAGPNTTESPWTRPGSNVSTVRIAAGCCVATRGAASTAERISQATVRFSQDSAGRAFKDGSGTIDDLVQGLRTGRIKPGDVPPIRVTKRGGELFTLDNRRLEAFRGAGIEIPSTYATPEEVAAEAFKFTTRNGGTSIRIRGGG